MMRSLYSGVAGLKNHQTRMDVTGNNIANVNTVGYKAGRTTFQDMLSQSVRGATSPKTSVGGVNPIQVGLGMGVASVDNIFTTGSMQGTGKSTDLAIDGDGFFMVKSGINTYYTRAGNFDFDAKGNYVVPGTGLQVMGWLADATGKIDTTGEPVPLSIPLEMAMAPRATTLIDYTGILNGSHPVGTTRVTSKEVYDSMGIAHLSETKFTKLDNYTWQVDFSVDGTDGTNTPTSYSAIIVFDENGKYLYDTFSDQEMTVRGPNKFAFTPTGDDQPGLITTSPFTLTDTTTTGATITTTVTYTVPPTVTYIDPEDNIYTYDAANNEYTSGGVTYSWSGTRWEEPGGSPMPGGGANPPTAYYSFQGADTSTSISVTGSTPCLFVPTDGAEDMVLKPNLTSLQNFGVESTAMANNQDGYTAGMLDRASLLLDSSGVIWGSFSNDQIMNLGQVALALFSNPGGMTKVGSSLFATSNNSGVPQVGTPNQGGYGQIMPSTLEMSNVDLSEEFTTMITTQRGFQANSRIITTSDTMLEELVNLKR